MANAERIRKLSDKELVETLIARIYMYCRYAEEMLVEDFRGVKSSN